MVTSNHDMILLCAEQEKSVVWIDPRGRRLIRTEFVALVFTRVEKWGALLDRADEPVCLHVMRTKTEVLTLHRARHLVEQRMRRLRARTRARTRRVPEAETLPLDEEP
jgi:hypothetical protein